MKQETGHASAAVFVLLIFAAFLLSAALLISMGSSEYQRIVDRSRENAEARTAAAYLTQKVRQNLGEDTIHVTELKGIPALEVDTRIGGKPFETYLYVLDGALMELLVSPDAVSYAIPASGTPILPVGSLTFSTQGSLLFIRGTGTGGTPIRAVLNIAP